MFFKPTNVVPFMKLFTSLLFSRPFGILYIAIPSVVLL